MGTTHVSLSCWTYVTTLININIGNTKVTLQQRKRTTWNERKFDSIKIYCLETQYIFRVVKHFVKLEYKKFANKNLNKRQVVVKFEIKLIDVVKVPGTFFVDKMY